eukprot:TRINITY_DN1431_c0_g2_i3.p2 TRINITY_DN1431_c0_g2~~TRINITY_DN1431_c0_g2_i3.p2  ORF type:complete len:129 (+),score=43.30 TRINITY_DN1431_c0_g2_i3:64-450(+)
MAANIDDIARSFVQFYYSLFDDKSKRANVAALFQANSMVTFVDTKVQGQEAILKHFTEGVNFNNVSHTPLSIDAQPTGPGILVFVTGHIRVDDSPNPLYYSEVFHLMPTDASNQSFWVLNYVFKLNYG